ncbi:hypothetical protein ACE7GA_21130 [Roseomonas sp. CCTCC AB2023176]|uniref:hypothetical protein n=1 Tax=Roseomonas sp. CCTCC AB2023176 TaxID=3342640 RepID=UPI0035D83DC8
MTARLTALTTGATLLLLAACAGAPAPPLRNEALRANDATAAACRADAERVVLYRDRGQIMRSDDYNARVGTTSYLGPRVITDDLARSYDRDRLAAECLRGAREASPAAAPAAPSGPAPRR